MKGRRTTTAAETAARFLASYALRADKLVADPGRRRQLGAIVAACRDAHRPIPTWVRVALFAAAPQPARRSRSRR